MDDCVGFNTHGWLKKACPNAQVTPGVDAYLISSSGGLGDPLRQ